MKQTIDRIMMQEQGRLWRGRRWRNPLTSLALVLSMLLGLTGWSTPVSAANLSSSTDAPQYASCLWYTIQGINVWPQTVANKFGISLRAFLIANNLRSDRFLHRGKVVCIPTRGVPRPPPGHDGDYGQPGTWTAQYWNNPDLSGPPAATSALNSLNFNWGYGTPDPARIMADNFSARFSRGIYSRGGVYRFYAQHDDGVRVSVDGNVALDAYGNVGDRLSAFDLYIAPGSHTLSVDYVERGGIARLKMTFTLLYVGTPLPDGGVVSPVGPGQLFPCTKPYLNESNLCVEQPYPAKRGSNISVVWRITTPFVQGEFDKGDGAGYKGPIYSEQRIIIENVTANRTIKLRWSDGSKWLTDQFTIQVVN